MTKKSPLEQAALMIVLESSNKITKSSASTAYVRQKLIGDLEQALRGLGWDMDTAIRRVLDAKKLERKASQERMRVLEAEQRAKHSHICDDCYDGPINIAPRADGLCARCRKPLKQKEVVS